MTFYFSAYSTPLLFGFIQGWVYAVLLWLRGYREERLSDKLLGWVLVALCFQIWIYMLGFGGIEIFWQQLDFFPRNLTYLLPPLTYFYLKSQFDASFRFRRRDLVHALPFAINLTYHLIVFAQGPAFVRQWQQNVHDNGIDDLEFLTSTGQQYLYLYWSFQLYRAYRAWIKTQFSETESVSFRWYRNFLVALSVSLTFSVVMTLIDLWLNLSFWQDWWGNLVDVFLIYYVSIEGYAQVQTARKLTFRPDNVPSPDSPSLSPISQPPVLAEPVSAPAGAEPVKPALAGTSRPETTLPDLSERLNELLAYMDAEKPYLDPDLALPDLARRLHTNPVLLSQVINAGSGKNFNDFVNAYRVDEFKRQVREPANAHLSFLGLALDCGFNSKATFNRAFKKFTGLSPKEFVGG
ncbi:response regulator receiver protein [Fibrella aestuarina BUZ 2]|uniref:Response regulator receiver protein n=1 Tax=Fibrella aestuarina BUZ 2 TaxID=1166018 RepID=I0K7H5_9BACT|nr:helix-turn-helix domain-containing protein [Fibrella aestuarina]CCH00078.1 response regulator receiver protein [Fibrella aestuarina BUZ 2]